MLSFIKNKAGFTLIELLVSMAILTIIIVPLSSLFVTSVRVNSNSREMLLANQLAQRYLEEAKHSPSPTPAVITDPASGLTTEIEITPEPKPGADSSAPSTPINSYTYTEPANFDFTIRLEVSGPNKIEYYYNTTQLFGSDTLNTEPINFTLSDGGAVGDKLLIKHINNGLDINPTGIEQTVDNTEYNMRILCNGDSAAQVTLNLTNRTDKKLNVYKIYNADTGGKNKVKINTYDGTIKIFNNNYYSSSGNYNYTFQHIKVTVRNSAGQDLVTLHGINK